MSDAQASNPYPKHGPNLEVEALRALAHPLRVRILDELSMYGPLTASGLGERLGESSGSTSYHLRQLEKHGLVREDTTKGNARDRWWERVPGPISIPDAGEFAAGSAERLATRLIGDEWMRSRDATLREFLADGSEVLSEQWNRLGVMDTINLRLTPEQMQSMVNDLDTVLWRYIDAHKASPSPGAWPVQVQLNAFPLVRGEEVAPAEGKTSRDVSGEEKNA